MSLIINNARAHGHYGKSRLLTSQPERGKVSLPDNNNNQYLVLRGRETAGFGRATLYQSDEVQMIFLGFKLTIWLIYGVDESQMPSLPNSVGDLRIFT